MEPTLDFRRVCVDHPEFRRLVVQDSKKYMIRQVPCILVFFSNGVVNKYEGEKAFEWVDETITKMKNVMSSMMPPSSPPSSSSPYMEQQSPKAFSKLPVERVEVEPVSPEPVEVSSSVDMRRRLDSAPLLRKTEESAKTDTEPTPKTTTDPNPRGIKSDKHESLLTLAQQMQKERDNED